MVGPISEFKKHKTASTEIELVWLRFPLDGGIFYWKHDRGDKSAEFIYRKGPITGNLTLSTYGRYLEHRSEV